MTEPFRFQKEDILKIESLDGRTLLALEMGLGKTLEFLFYLKRNPQPRPAIVVCPASVKFQWQADAWNHCRIKAHVISGTGRQAIPRAVKLVIVNYDILKSRLPDLLKVNSTLIGLDEVQCISSPNTQRTKATLRLCRGVPHILPMSGTPLMNRPIELFPVINLLWPEIFPSYWEFGWEFCEPRMDRGKWTFKGSTKTGKLHKILSKCGMIRRTKLEVLPDLPEKIRQIVPIELKDHAQYIEADTNFRKWILKHKPGRAIRALKSEQLSRINYLLMLVAKLKIRGICNWIDTFLEDTDEKLVLFCVHRKMIEALERKYDGQIVSIHGSIPSGKRKALIDRFQRDHSIRLIIGNIAMASGVNGLQSVSSSVAFLEMFWRPADHTQAADRLRRIGQRKTVWEYWLAAPDTVEERMMKILQKKQEGIRRILDGESGGESLSVFDLLLQSLTKGK